MTTLKIVPDSFAVPQDAKLLGLVFKRSDNLVYVGESSWNAISETKELTFSFGGMVPSPIRIGTESDSGVLLLFNSDHERNIFLAELTKRKIDQ